MNLTKSLKMQKRASARIPGMTQLLSKRPSQFAPGVWPGYFQKAKGAEVWDLDGNHYIDMSIAGIGANVLGYADPDVDKAVRKAVQNGTSCSLNCPEEVELADLLCEIHPWAEQVRYARTGGESMAVAVRIARAFTNRDVIAFCGYHGWHDWYLAANLAEPTALADHLMASLEPIGVPKCLSGTALSFRYNCLGDLENIAEKNKGKLAAVVMEPIRCVYPDDGFLEGVKQIAAKNGAILIFDEISAAFRLNSGGSHLLFGVEPDIAVFSKAMGNGYPIGAIIGRRRVMKAVEKTFISSTYWTERIGPTAALATIKKHCACDVGKHLSEIGSRVQNGWKRISEKNKLKIYVAGIPPLSHFTFDGERSSIMKTLFVQKMLERGFLASTLFYAMYAHNAKQVEKYLEAVDAVFFEICKANKKGVLKSMLKGSIAAHGFRKLQFKKD